MERLHQYNLDHKDELEEKMKSESDQFNRRVDAVLELKANLDSVQESFARQARINVEKVERVKQTLENEKEDLRSQGLNPYYEFRKKEFDTEANIREKTLKRNVDINKTKLMESLQAEQNEILNREAQMEKLMEYEKKHRADNGRHVVEDRNMKYLKKMTFDGRELIDPSAQQTRVFPSQVVVIPDNSFGLGETTSRLSSNIRTKINEKLQQELNVIENDFGEFNRLVPSKLNDNDSSINQILSPRKYDIKPLSKFEENALNKVRLKHYNRLQYGSSQIAGTKVFPQGSFGFVSKPNEIVFKDFEVGKKYSMKFTMTNASYTFNSFKLLDFDDQYYENFSITYESLGRMSAGTSVSLSISFIPTNNEDISTFIHFQSETGMIDVPIRCLIQRCAPRVMTPTIDFGKVILGQSSTFKIWITNTQSQSCDYQICKVKYDENGNEVVQTIERKKTVNFIDDTKSLGRPMSETELLGNVDKVITAFIRRKKHENPSTISIDETEGFISGYDKISIDVFCMPLYLQSKGLTSVESDVICETFKITFMDVDERDGTLDDTGSYVRKHQYVTCQVDCNELPLYLSSSSSISLYHESINPTDEVSPVPIVDFQAIFTNTIYRSNFFIHNRSNISYVAAIKLKTWMKKYIEVTPTDIIVQPQSKQEINVKIQVSDEIFHDTSISKFLYLKQSDADSSQAILYMPLDVIVKNQDFPLVVIIKAYISQSRLKLSSNTLDFGEISATSFSSSHASHSITLPLTVTNNSMLAQKVMFRKIKKCLEISPHNGFAVLLPNETKVFDIGIILFPKERNYDFEIELVSSANEKYPIRILANVKLSPIILSSNCCSLDAYLQEGVKTDSFYIQNISNLAQEVEIVVPDARFSWLKVSPTVLHLQPGEARRLEVEFQPPMSGITRDLDPIEWYKELSKSVASSPPFDSVKNISLNWISFSGAYGDVLWVSPKSFSDDSMNHLNDSSENIVSSYSNLLEEEWGIAGSWRLPIFIRHSSSSENIEHPLYFAIHTMLRLPILNISQSSLDFGIMHPNDRKVLTFDISNVGFEDVTLSSSVFQVTGPFAIIRALRPIKAKAQLTVYIEACPIRIGSFVERLFFKNKERNISTSISIKCTCVIVK